MSTKEIYNQLLVEGNDDLHVIKSLCQRFNVNENFDVINCEGIDKLISQIPIRIKQSGIKTIGIIVDADFEIQKRRLEIYRVLEKVGYSIKPEMNPDGLIFLQSDMPKIGVWIMPNNEVNGMLEDFVAFLIPEDDKLMPIAKKVLEEIESTNINNYSLIHHSKALINTWLAWQEVPGLPMGAAITKRYLTVEHEQCKRFINWLIELYKTN